MRVYHLTTILIWLVLLIFIIFKKKRKTWDPSNDICGWITILFIIISTILLIFLINQLNFNVIYNFFNTKIL